MAQESEDGQEKTEDPTPKREKEAREKGDVARSKELNTTVVLLAGAGGLLAFGGYIAEVMQGIFRFNFALPRQVVFDEHMMFHHLGQSVYEALSGLIPFFLLLLLAALLGPIALGGWNMSAKALEPKFSRMNPLSGIKRMFSKQSLMELAKAVAKVAVVGSLSALLLYSMRNDLLAIAQEATLPAMEHALQVLGWSFLGMSATMIIIALVDIPFQVYQHQEKLKMTMQEVKDEMKNTEGKPEVKGRIRQLQQEMARQRMMSDVPEADVVITNPSHYAVALRYDVEAEGAPLLVAKGSDVIAFRIREVAVANEVPVLGAPPLARAIYHSTEIGEEIPEGLYIAVAQILAYVYQLKQYQAGKGQRPGKVPDVPIPDELRQDD